MWCGVTWCGVPLSFALFPALSPPFASPLHVPLSTSLPSAVWWASHTRMLHEQLRDLGH